MTRVLRKEVWPFQLLVRMDALSTTNSVEKLLEVENWCAEYIGNRFNEWYSYNLGDKHRIFAFKDEATLLVFKLKWGQYAIQ